MAAAALYQISEMSMSSIDEHGRTCDWLPGKNTPSKKYAVNRHKHS